MPSGVVRFGSPCRGIRPDILAKQRRGSGSMGCHRFLTREPMHAITLLASPITVGVMALGLSNTSFDGVPLPASIEILGGEPGCVALCDWLELRVGTSVAYNTVSMEFTIPDVPALNGATFYSQYFGNTGTLRSSNGMASRIGLY